MSDDPGDHGFHDDDDEGRVSAPYGGSPTTGTRTKARTYAMSSMRTSREGLAFIIAREGSGRETDGLHWPEGNSGVTLGFGYDFYDRSPNTIVSDLTSIGVSRAIAETLSTASIKQGRSAEQFVKEHAELIKLSDYQKQALLQKTIVKYEDDIKRLANFPVTQYQFDALVSLAYNPGPHLYRITRGIAAGKFENAEKDWLSRMHSGHRIMGGLVDRRRHEVNLYKNGVYR